MSLNVELLVTISYIHAYTPTLLVPKGLFEIQRSKLQAPSLLATFNCKMVAITRLSPEFWSPKIFPLTMATKMVAALSAEIKILKDYLQCN